MLTSEHSQLATQRTEGIAGEHWPTTTVADPWPPVQSPVGAAQGLGQLSGPPGAEHREQQHLCSAGKPFPELIRA